ncbi:hypothetical protein EMIT0347P_100099 [Pseudomonas sp. IT-347P]
MPAGIRSGMSSTKDQKPLTPALSRRERGPTEGAALYIDLKNRVDYGFSAALSRRHNS